MDDLVLHSESIDANGTYAHIINAEKRFFTWWVQYNIVDCEGNILETFWVMASSWNNWCRLYEEEARERDNQVS